MNFAKKALTIAVDFDGTIVEHCYPEIGEELPGAFEVLKELQERGHRLILWTVRDGIDLQNAVDYCLSKGIIFWAVNASFPDEEFNKYISRKIDADVFIDDRNVGGFPGWYKIREILIPDSPYLKNNKNNPNNQTNRKKGFWQNLFK
ncbi:MAG TPA: hypothetical protein P5538_04745 [Bacteroidales bacterium]|jgi:hypothetical protein|nr:hypothetical protein [Bacteroidales bacterium]HOL98949.1 hypothetical protein [Bacteroidales bacterium]HOM37208.1 hypothetical protein [Bacteroidales bacterium]HPD24181.1 hypothetical protein [Bacteroidales bacterium]HRS99865.1 hypothetical protein [Bacteroidales bacterium]